jgi:hypothetical protein
MSIICMWLLFCIVASPVLEFCSQMKESFRQEREWKAERRWREAQKKGGRS